MESNVNCTKLKSRMYTYKCKMVTIHAWGGLSVPPFCVLMYLVIVLPTPLLKTRIGS